MSLILGRWLLIGTENLLQCYDLDAANTWDEPVMQQQAECSRYKNFQGLTTTSGAGAQAAYLVVCGDQLL